MRRQCRRAGRSRRSGLGNRSRPSRMENLIGEEANDWRRYVSDPTARLHLYGKAKARPGRKMGHVTWVHPLGTKPERMLGQAEKP